MATTTDAELILKLYELRTEGLLRKARQFMAIEFHPQTLEELLEVTRGFGTEKNAYWRQVTSYWEMAASFVLRGALDPDLFFDSNAEPFFLLAKLHRLREAYQKETGAVLMRQVAMLIEKYPAAAAKYEGMMKGIEARAAAAKG
jgi:hypothetical protein